MRKGLSFRRRRKLNTKIIKSLWIYVAIVVVAAGIGVSATLAFFRMHTQIGLSMEPTIAHAQGMYINHMAYSITSPNRNDVVIFQVSHSNTDQLSVKRVVGIPGDRIQIIDGYLYVNGEEEDGDFDKMQESGIAAEEIVLGEEEFFVLGDNRNNSTDSRFTSIGIITKEQIVGKVWFALFSETGSPGIID